LIINYHLAQGEVYISDEESSRVEKHPNGLSDP